MQLLFVPCIILLYTATNSVATLILTSKTDCLNLSLKDFRACSSILESWSRGREESPVVIAHGYLVHESVDPYGPLKIDEVIHCFKNAKQRFLDCKNL